MVVIVIKLVALKKCTYTFTVSCQFYLIKTIIILVLCFPKIKFKNGNEIHIFCYKYEFHLHFCTVMHKNITSFVAAISNGIDVLHGLWPNTKRPMSKYGPRQRVLSVNLADPKRWNCQNQTLQPPDNISNTAQPSLKASVVVPIWPTQTSHEASQRSPITLTEFPLPHLASTAKPTLASKANLYSWPTSTIMLTSARHRPSQLGQPHPVENFASKLRIIVYKY